MKTIQTDYKTEQLSILDIEKIVKAYYNRGNSSVKRIVWNFQNNKRMMQVTYKKRK